MWYTSQWKGTPNEIAEKNLAFLASWYTSTGIETKPPKTTRQALENMAGKHHHKLTACINARFTLAERNVW